MRKHLFKTLALVLLATCGFMSADGAVTFRFYRFSTEGVRSGGNSSVQLAEFQFYSESGLLAQSPQISNPGGINPEGEGPANLKDSDLETKWLDFTRSPLVFDFGVPVAIDHYGFITANDFSSRDPVRWTFEGSPDGTNWTLLDDRSGENQPVSTFRHATYEWDLTEIPDLPAISLNVSAGELTSAVAINLPQGGTAILEWSAQDATGVSVKEGSSTISTNSSGSLEVSPTATTVYTVTADNSVGTAAEELTVYVGAPVADLVLNEFAADLTGDSGLIDEDGEPSDWIEIYNPNPFAVALEGYGLTDDATLGLVWNFPAASLDAESYRVVFASGKNRAVVGSEWHTDFGLSKTGEFLALIGPGGSPVSSLDPYPAMFPDVSYGIRPSDGLWDFFTDPTPGAVNDSLPGAPGALVTFSTPPGTFASTINVGIQTESAQAEIRYTTDGSVPDETSTLYTGPLTLTASTMVKARTFEAGRAPGKVAAASYLRTTSTLGNFSSNLPVVVLENFGAGAVPSDRTLQAASFSLFEPDPVTGRTTLTSMPTDSHRCGIKRRGSSTINDPKGSYRLEFWKDGSDEENKVSLLDLPKHDEWVLYAPYLYDRAMVRNAFLFGVSNDLGRWAPKTRFCEVYLNTNGGSLAEADYQGVYVLMERISRDGDRVDVEKLTVADNSGPEVTGGYILSIDRADPEDLGFRSAMGHPFDPPNGSPQPTFNHVYPKEQNITPQQAGYIRGYIDDMETALYGPAYRDPETGYRAWLDAAASIDHHLMVTFSKDPDGLRLSTYLYKPRLGKLAFGPLWDFDRAMGPDNDNRAADPQGWNPLVERAEFFEYDYWGRLFQDPDFMQQWIDRWQELRRGVLADGAMVSRVESMVQELGEAEVRNAARWPSVAPNGGPLSTLSGYPGEIDHLENWLVQRAGWIDGQFLQAPGITPGGQVEPGAVVEVQPTEGSVWYTTDGSDPRLPGGGVNPSAVPIANGTVDTVLVSETSTVVKALRPTTSFPGVSAWTAPGFDDSGWLTGNFGVGYELSNGYEPYLSTVVHSGGGGAPTSVYVRAPFSVSLPESGYQSLTLRLRYEDGFVAYLNGTRIASSNAPSSLSWNSASTDVRPDSQAVNFADFDVSAFSSLLVDGENLLAIHSLNEGNANGSNTGSSSSDLLVSAELIGSFNASGSGELTLEDTTRVIARSFSQGEWSGPVSSNFVVGRPATALNLVVSEVMYHPANPSAAEEAEGFLNDGEFEYLELQNISASEDIDLAGVTIRNCFDFDFPSVGGTIIPPGGCVLLVRNQAAIELRYGGGLPIVGEWGDASLPDGGSNLSNSGEQITVLAADGSVIQDFVYDDGPPWPVTPDGDGPSMELVSPFSSPDHTVAANWRASMAPAGTPGTATGVFSSWAAGFFTTAELDDASVSGPDADPDHDGLSNVIELAFGSSPVSPSADRVPTGQLVEVGSGENAETYLTITFTRDPSVPGYSAAPEFGSNLETWTGAGVLLQTVAQPDGTETVTYRDSSPAGSGRRFARVRVSGSL